MYPRLKSALLDTVMYKNNADTIIPSGHGHDGHCIVTYVGTATSRTVFSTFNQCNCLKNMPFRITSAIVFASCTHLQRIIQPLCNIDVPGHTNQIPAIKNNMNVACFQEEKKPPHPLGDHYGNPPKVQEYVKTSAR